MNALHSLREAREQSEARPHLVKSNQVGKLPALHRLLLGSKVLSEGCSGALEDSLSLGDTPERQHLCAPKHEFGKQGFPDATTLPDGRLLCPAAIGAMVAEATTLPRTLIHR